MVVVCNVVLSLCLLHSIGGVKVKMVMHSEAEDSAPDEEETRRTDSWDHIKKKIKDSTILPFLRHKHVDERQPEYEEPKTTTEKVPERQMHPNDMLFPLIYKQTHINSMFKFGENWYTWSTDKRSDGSKVTNYYVCYEEPKHCDDVGWEHADALPKCAFQIDSLTNDDRACLNSFGVEPHSNGICDGADQMKVSEIVRSCGGRIRSLWRFVRVGRRPAGAPKPADVNSLICEDEEECYVSVEYRIHRDRITFSLHEPTRGQTFKSALKRDLPGEEELVTKPVERPTDRPHVHRPKKVRDEERSKERSKKSRGHKKAVEGKGIAKERNDSGYSNRRTKQNKIKVREDVSEDVSE